MPYDIDTSWREIDLGGWEGLTREEVESRFPDELAGLRAGEPVRLGGGESLVEFRARIEEALSKLIAGLDDGQRALVVTHGGVIGGVAAAALGLEPTRRRSIARLTNCSLTTISIEDERLRLLGYNDASHLGPLVGWAAERRLAGDTVVSLIRHGETRSNVSGRWQGLGDDDLSEAGGRQVRALAGWYGELDVIYASALRRARQTAAALAGEGRRVGDHAQIHEMSMGEWEGRTVAEIQAGWADLWRRIYEEGEDLPRGVSGEAFWQVAARMRGALAELADRHVGARVGIVSHRGAIRAYIGDMLGLDHLSSRRRLGPPANTSVSHVVVGGEGTVLADYNVAPHLELTA